MSPSQLLLNPLVIEYNTNITTESIYLTNGEFGVRIRIVFVEKDATNSESLEGKRRTSIAVYRRDSHGNVQIKEDQMCSAN
jgi:hypothetical protein